MKENSRFVKPKSAANLPPIPKNAHISENGAYIKSSDGKKGNLTAACRCAAPFPKLCRRSKNI